MEEIEELRAKFSYDERDGSLTHQKSGLPAGWFDKRCRFVYFRGKRVREHRVCWAIKTGEWPNKIIDHVNGNSADNRWGNLRLATHSQNMCNRAVSRSKKSSVFLGVSATKDAHGNPRFRAVVRSKGVVTRGPWRRCQFWSAVDYDKIAKEIHGEFARPNFQQTPLFVGRA